MAVEIRYCKNANVTVNGLSCKSLAIDLSGSGISTNKTVSGQYAGCPVAVDVVQRTSAGVETVIGEKVAQVTVADGETEVLKSATWACPETALNSTDSIVVRVYARFGLSWYLIGIAEFTTEQLGASQLDAETWTVYYYLSFAYSSKTNSSRVTFWFDGTDHSRIENFCWTLAVTVKKVLMDGFVFVD